MQHTKLWSTKLFLSDWRFALYLHFPYLRFPYMRFPSLRNALFRTCLFRTCVFQYLRFQRPQANCHVKLSSSKLVKNIVVLWYKHYSSHCTDNNMFTAVILKITRPTVQNCCNKEKDAAAKCRTWSTVNLTLIASVCQSLSQKFPTAVWYFDDNEVKLICLSI